MRDWGKGVLCSVLSYIQSAGSWAAAKRVCVTQHDTNLITCFRHFRRQFPSNNLGKKSITLGPKSRVNGSLRVARIGEWSVT